MSAPRVRVEKVIDGETYSAQLTLDPAPFITAIARLHLVPVADRPAHLADIFTLTFTPSETEALSADFYDAAAMPDQCAYDESFSVVVVEGVHLCAKHAHAYDQVNQPSSLSILHQVAADIENTNIRVHLDILAARAAGQPYDQELDGTDLGAWEQELTP
jgi:hypothetical protein